MSRKLLIAVLLPIALVVPVKAQPTNVEVLGSLAVKCLGGVPGDIEAFRLVPGPRMPFLRPFLTRHWISQDYTVFIDDSTVAQNGRAIHRLQYDPQAAGVEYSRTRGDSLLRRIDLSISHSFVSPQGILVDEARCDETASDVVRTSDVKRLQPDPWTEARGQLPPVRGWRKWAEPAVIGTSIAAVVYLFFSLRSE